MSPPNTLRRPGGLGSIGGRLVAATVLLGLLVSAAGTALLLWRARLAEIELTTQRVGAIGQNIVPGLQKSLWFVDGDQVEVLLDGIAAVPGVEYVELRSDGDPIRTRGAPVANPLLERRFPLAHVDGRAWPLGELRVVVGQRRLAARLGAQAASLALSTTIGLLGTALLFLVLFRFWVTRHLGALATHLREMRFETPASSLALAGKTPRTPPDELDQVVDGINRMRERLDAYLSLRARDQAELARHRDHLEQLVRARTAQLEDSEARLRLIADHMPALISHIDRERCFTFNNRAYAEWLERPLAEITGRSLEQVYGAEMYARLAPHLDRAFAGEEVTFELQAARRYVRATYIPALDREGAVVGVYGLVQDVTDTKRVERELRVQAEADPLTGLANRRQFEARLAAAVEDPDRALAVAFLDLDYFKRINDTLGHAGGDLALKAFARRLLDSVRPADMVARLAGDEFTILMDGVRTAAEAARVGERIQAQMAAPMDLAGTPLAASTSVGIALRRPGEAADALLRRADAALYAAKAVGRATCRLDDGT